MSYTEFKSAVSDKILRIHDAEEGIFEVHAARPGGIFAGIALDAAAAPELALAALEAAAPEAGEHPVDSAEYAYFEAINWLQTVVSRRAADADADAAAAAEWVQLHLDAHALLVADAHPGSASTPTSFAGWGTYDQERGMRLARAARSLAVREMVAEGMAVIL